MSTSLRGIAQLSLRGRRVFLRTDLNVPIRDGRVRDDLRIRASMATLEHLRKEGARVIVASHLGRPGGERVEGLSLRPVAEVLGVPLAPDCIGPDTEAVVEGLRPGEAILLENLRFHPGETANDAGFAGSLARLADCYVNDAFGTAHRAHASTVGLAERCNDRAAGLLLEREVAALSRLRDSPEHPYVCILGGAKVSDKLAVLEALTRRADVIAIGGAMAYTFLLARGEPVGRSLVESDRVEAARRLLDGPAEVLLPLDHVVAPSPEQANDAKIVDRIPDGLMGLDIGPRTIDRFEVPISSAANLFWNGPLGLFEQAPFDRGTRAIGEALCASPGYSVIGGGDSLAAIRAAGLADRIDHLSTGGGASLEFIQGRDLPGLRVLEAP
ncbi:MAG: phosphoglycerate kinase [Myxococcota bacterium]